MPWFASDPDVYVPGSPGTSGHTGDVCPQGWDETFDRAQMTTQVFIGRTLPGEIPELNYTLVVGVPLPGTGQIDFNPGDDQLTPGVFMQIDRHTSDGLDAYSWLQYLVTGCTIRLYDPAFPKITRTYTVNGLVEFFDDQYFSVPVVWSDGEGDEGGPVNPGPYRLVLTLIAEPPQLWEDTLGRSLYGPQPLQRLDLINTSTDLFETLADRILEVRGVNSVPRIEAVTLDARTGVPSQMMELMSSAAPERPSRYRMRLAVDERPIFDRMCFVSAVRHFVAPGEWTLRISLDVAEWAAQL